MNEMIAQAKVSGCISFSPWPVSVVWPTPQVYAIRDAQLAEKEAIKAELAEEEHRLDDVCSHRVSLLTSS